MLLIAAAAAGVFAAAVPPGRVFMSPLPEYLRIIRATEWRWRASAWGFAVSTVVLAVALWFAEGVSGRNVDGETGVSYPGAYGLAALVVFVVVAPCWLATLALRLDLTVAAARGQVDPTWYDAIGKWSTSLYGFFMVGGHTAVALLGASMIGVRAVPPWAAWATVALGTVQAISFLVAWPRPFGMRGVLELPVMVPLIPLLVAVPLALN
jgi:hypothetical protein